MQMRCESLSVRTFYRYCTDVLSPPWDMTHSNTLVNSVQRERGVVLMVWLRPRTRLSLFFSPFSLKDQDLVIKTILSICSELQFVNVKTWSVIVFLFLWWCNVCDARFINWILVLLRCRSLVYDGSQMLFYTGDMKSGSPSSTTHAISITNTFNVTIVVYNIMLAPSSRDMFTVSVSAAHVVSVQWHSWRGFRISSKPRLWTPGAPSPM